MNINQRDIFLYVFDQRELEKAKIHFIKKNLDKFRNELMLLEEINNSLNNNEIKESILLKIMQKIKEQNTISPFIEENIIESFDFNSKDKRTYSAPTLLVSKFKSEIFKDFNSNYLIKLITKGNERKIFAFTNKSNIKERVKITLEPSGKSYELKVNEESVVITTEEEIKNIYLTPID